ncbi:MAG: hypothetical protein NVSMB52_02550 [Chloroflexota bacterium]
MHPRVRAAVVRLSTSIYAALLIAYPRPFRHEYGTQMTQVFRTACLHAARSEPVSGLSRFWVRAVYDLFSSAFSERAATLRGQHQVTKHCLYGTALAISVLTGSIHLRLDADGLVIVLLIGGTFLCGLVSPTGAWRWGVIAGMGIPVALLLGHGSDALLFPHRDTDLPWPIPLLPAIIAAYCGAALHHLLPWSSRAFKVDREYPKS